MCTSVCVFLCLNTCVGSICLSKTQDRFFFRKKLKMCFLFHLYSVGPDPPQIDIRPHSVTDKGFFALEKATVWLTCQASSNPLSEYVWFYNNSLVDTGPILTIAYISRRQAGLYTCLSENKYINTSSESTVTLSVYCESP